MESVIERGQARCPRCVAVADYCFIESAPNLLRYEVDCRHCGEVYRELHGPVPPTFGALATTDEWTPPVSAVPLRQRMSAWADTVRQRRSELSSAASAALDRQPLPAWLTVVVSVARTPARPERQ